MVVTKHEFIKLSKELNEAFVQIEARLAALEAAAAKPEPVKPKK
jgi:hypothetical protein